MKSPFFALSSSFAIESATSADKKDHWAGVRSFKRRFAGWLDTEARTANDMAARCYGEDFD